MKAKPVSLAEIQQHKATTKILIYANAAEITVVVGTQKLVCSDGNISIHRGNVLLGCTMFLCSAVGSLALRVWTECT